MPTQVIGADMDTTNGVLVTGDNRGIKLATCREIDALARHIRKRELIDW